MTRPTRSLPLLLLFAVLPLAGCTLFPEKQPATLATTTSAEQHERIFWQMAAARQWQQMQPLLAANVLWKVPGRTLGRDDVQPFLAARGAREYALRDLTVRPNGPDMTLAYTLVVTRADGGSEELDCMSIWQQTERRGKARPAGAWIMTAHSEHVRS